MMIPNKNTVLTEEIQIEAQSSRSFQALPNRTGNFVDGIDAMKQAIHKILNTERYDYLIYSWNYGIELKDLFGEPLPFVQSELEDRITEALTQDDRIDSVTDFEFTFPGRSAIHVAFTVNTIFGRVNEEMEVEV